MSDCLQPHGILQARILEWVAVPFSRGSSQSGVEPRSSALQVDSLPAEPQGKPKNTGVGNLSLLQGIFPTQELNWGLLHCRRILHQLSYQGSPDVSGKLPHLLGGRYTCLLHDFGLDHMTCFGQRKCESWAGVLKGVACFCWSLLGFFLFAMRTAYPGRN